MTPLAAASLTVDTLVKVVISALAAGLGVTVAVSTVIYCIDRASELRRSGRAGAAWAMSAGGVAALVACAALVVYGLLLLTAKGK